jgi:hypothetical protein
MNMGMVDEIALYEEMYTRICENGPADVLQGVVSDLAG